MGRETAAERGAAGWQNGDWEEEALLVAVVARRGTEESGEVEKLTEKETA